MTDTHTHRNRSTVLIIDGSEDSRHVLRTALERRGVRIFEAQYAETGLELARKHRPAVIVLDSETIPIDDPTVRDSLGLETEDQGTPLVVLGNISKSEALQTCQTVVRKPYHYGPLVRKIEELLTTG